MRKRRLLWQLFPSYLLIMLLSLTAVGWYASRELRDSYLDQTLSRLQATVRLAGEEVLDRLRVGDHAEIDRLAKELGRLGGARITVILRSGQVIGDSHNDPAAMPNLAGRPEVARALEWESPPDSPPEPVLRERMMYVAAPLLAEGVQSAAIRVGAPTTQIDQALRRIYWKIGLGGVVIALITTTISLGISRAISRPLEEIRRGADQFAAGKFGRKLSVPETEEVAGVADAMNRMAAQLDDRLKIVLRQRNELEGVLASMTEGVLAVDAEERVIKLNHAAAELIGVRAEDTVGRSIQEAVRNPSLQQLVARALQGASPVEGDIVVHGHEPRFLQAHGAALRDAEGRKFGALVVLNDVTRLRRLENVRRDFVANVSHELKTPVTSIKGFVETLLDGAMNQPEQARVFLEIVAKHAARLEAIIEDLLILSRLDQEEEAREMAREDGDLREVLQAALAECDLKARTKQINVDIACPDGLRLSMNAALVEQAVINLIDNAVKYSESGSSVRVEGSQEDGEAVIRVSDRGCGIEPEHLARIFERFYRVDKARSRKQGGTGLGLAIVKHIVQAHDGRVEVESAVGQGSVFTIRIPLNAGKN